MADWRSLAKKLALVDERIESQDARILKEELFGDDKIDTSSVNFLISLRREAKSVAVEFDETVFGVVKQVMIKNGAISPDQTRWLKGFLGSNENLRKHERAFLLDLQSSGGKHCPEFVHWCQALGVYSTSVTDAETKASPFARTVPTVIAAPEDEPITVTPIEALGASGMPGWSAAGTTGFFSLAVALFVYLGTFLLVAMLAVKNPQAGQNSSASVVAGLGIIASLPIALIGLILGLLGAFRPSSANRLCAILGLVFNGLVVLGCSGGIVGMIFFGMGAPK